MDDDTRMIPIDDLHFEKRTNALPSDLIDRITLIHNTFRDYLPATLEETIDNFKYDENPESEIRIWEHMGSVILTVRYTLGWPHDKVLAAVKVVLGLSMGAVQDNSLSEEETRQVAALWNAQNPR